MISTVSVSAPPLANSLGPQQRESNKLGRINSAVLSRTIRDKFDKAPRQRSCVVLEA